MVNTQRNSTLYTDTNTLNVYDEMERLELPPSYRNVMQRTKWNTINLDKRKRDIELDEIAHPLKRVRTL